MVTLSPAGAPKVETASPRGGGSRRRSDRSRSPGGRSRLRNVSDFDDPNDWPVERVILWLRQMGPSFEQYVKVCGGTVAVMYVSGTNIFVVASCKEELYCSLGKWASLEGLTITESVHCCFCGCFPQG